MTLLGAGTIRPALDYLKSPRVLIGLLSLALLLVLVRLPFYAVPLITDEGAAAYTAIFWSADHQLYRDINYDRPQGFFLVYQLIFALLGDDTVAIRLGAALYSVGTMVAIFLLAQSIGGRLAAWVAALTFCLFSTAPTIEGFTANAEHFTLLPLTLSALLSWRRRWVWAGVCAGIACAIKPIGLSALVLALAWCAANRSGWRAALTVSAGFFGPILAMVAHGWWIGWEHVWRVFVEQRLLAYSLIATDGTSQLAKLIDSLAQTHTAWIVPLLLTLVATIFDKSTRSWFGGGDVSTKPGQLQFVWLWLLSAIFGMAMGGEWHRHYYVQLLPTLAVGAGMGVAALRPAPDFHRWLWATALVACLAWSTFNEGRFWLMSPKEISFALYKRPEYLVADAVAKHIAGQTAESDSIYVAFAHADIYFLARRRAALPQQLFWLQIARNHAIQEAAFDTIQRRKPAMILWVQDPPPEWLSPEALQRLISAGYSLEKDLSFPRLYRRKP